MLPPHITCDTMFGSDPKFNKVNQGHSCFLTGSPSDICWASSGLSSAPFIPHTGRYQDNISL